MHTKLVVFAIVCCASSCGAKSSPDADTKQSHDVEKRNDVSGDNKDKDSRENLPDAAVEDSADVPVEDSRDTTVKVLWEAPAKIPIDVCQPVSVRFENLDGTPFHATERFGVDVLPKSYFIMYRNSEDCEAQTHGSRLLDLTLSVGDSACTLYVRNYVPETVVLSAMLWAERFNHPHARVTLEFF